MKPKTLQQAVQYFSDLDNCLAYMSSKRWPDGVVTCPTCGRKDVSFLANQRKWQCKSAHAKRQFSAKVGTIFEDSPIPLEKWLVVVWMLTNSKNGVSSYEISRAIGVTQKSAWFMLHRIRLGLKDGQGFGAKTKLGATAAKSKLTSLSSGVKQRTCIAPKPRAMRFPAPTMERLSCSDCLTATSALSAPGFCPTFSVRLCRTKS